MVNPKTTPKDPPPPDDEPDDPVDLPEGLSPTVGVPVDPTTGKCYKSGEIPPGWNEPVS